MKQHIKGFFYRGTLAAPWGPVVLAIIYGVLGATGKVDSLPAGDVCKGILTITLMAFLAGSINEVYQIEQLPLPLAIGIHAVVLYLDYILIYLVNGWLKKQLTAILIFTGIFLAGFALIWLVIYLVTKYNTKKINENLLP